MLYFRFPLDFHNACFLLNKHTGDGWMALIVIEKHADDPKL